jgi:hypothetical protein
MDEVDGRPGAVARKSGHSDASIGVLTLSLSLPEPGILFCSIVSTIPQSLRRNP